MNSSRLPRGGAAFWTITWSPSVPTATNDYLHKRGEITMRFGYRARCGCCVLLLGSCLVVLAACAGVPWASPSSNQSNSDPPAPSVAAFCPSPDALAPIVGETMTPDFSTGTHGSLTSCGYRGPTGDICGVELSAWRDAQRARDD